MRLMLIAAVAALGALPVRAEQQQPCALRSEAIGILADNYGETAVAIGLSSRGTMIEIFASDAGTWTIVETNVVGMSCIRASGDAFDAIRAAIPLPDAN